MLGVGLSSLRHGFPSCCQRWQFTLTTLFETETLLSILLHPVRYVCLGLDGIGRKCRLTIPLEVRHVISLKSEWSRTQALKRVIVLQTGARQGQYQIKLYNFYSTENLDKTNIRITYVNFFQTLAFKKNCLNDSGALE